MGSDVGIGNIQKKLLEMLSFFHEFCIENDIKYFAVGGTTLGAVRHDGFIPWDDDIDVGLPRQEYERLIELFPKENNRYVIESVYSPDNNFCYSFSKIYDTSTTLVENTTKNLIRGIYIDVFPIDGIGNTEDEAIKSFQPINRMKNILTLRTVMINKKREWYKNLILWFIQHIPRFLLDEKKLCQKINNYCKIKEYENCEIVGNLVGAWGIKELMPKKLFSNPQLHKFEDIEIYIQENYDGYLSHLYGDWRKLPPEEKRITHHDYILDLDHSYLSSTIGGKNGV